MEPSGESYLPWELGGRGGWMELQSSAKLKVACWISENEIQLYFRPLFLDICTKRREIKRAEIIILHRQSHSGIRSV